ncbi:ABC-type multidrug transport system, ATPase component [Clostridium pasteurianum DSM 525 = ATCC 6013]|uniref:ABC transporter related protein n=1 Tax=Clostridium pasteurianum DSM 525 = ATCC 6013 TaxID=1262449 RepID=A0A0H3J3R2_CLOPA|nr:ATP-binding cassette domain-containing protein [Clostridium pasteurianum]AJA48566.1 ABC-type multidrug transport system, ATPase component [Clostridium pasteurianum DSM 525 = ATCC 6013]AJA52554.1 ABC-type multidrug transport system, ATPase component [Clostridium pasteurianum DSM 525 = ATCC 6013]AOZ75798.1 multidrug ABC transporter ATP-binding protein [Clostridium pasteurianum DSM 525 = ATCC 6013]AOZ79594.1 multidrug ABC transporter ATP-binding protein [Clostridium pasteurianum]ELP57955.1 mul
MNNLAVCVNDVCKAFKENQVLKNVSINFEKNKIHGLIGRNGSGKTMLLKCICGFVPITSGEIIVNDKRIGKDTDVPKDVGIIIETPGFLPNYNGYKNLKFLASINNIIDKKDIKSVIKRVGLDPESKKWVGKYSLGMRQRLGMAQAIMENPSILLLDEPLNGIDKHGVKDMRELLIKLRDEGKTIILASHSAEDIEMLCDTVSEMDSGVLTVLR